ncbi:caspase-7-like [Dunckerocampus dactyliophorus]|uniref:caspase-7-like n=1 Tax=Dunckerocampus dactyliophorus TaxID=161453 RepID=UPI0024061D5E|nr:caspase-7-like [Dunckerocampus dactyliophorus]
MEAAKRAVLVTVAAFDPGVPLNRRPGATKDARRLHRILTRLDFKVDLHQDLHSHEIYSLFRKESRRPVSECFLAVLSSHGEDGCVFGADGKRVWLSRVFAFFDHVDMEQKVKVFLVQACRGGVLDDGVVVDSGGGGSGEPAGDVCSDISAPVNTLVMYATVPGYVAFMHPTGSVFLQTFCSLLEEEEHRRLELTRLMTRLSHSVAYTFQAKGRQFGVKKEMPCFLTRMTREAFPFAEPRKDGAAAGLSAVTLLGGDVAKKRTPSIS